MVEAEKPEIEVEESVSVMDDGGSPNDQANGPGPEHEEDLDIGIKRRKLEDKK